MTIYIFDLLLSQFGTSLLFHVQFSLLLLDLHTDFSGGRSGGLVFPSLVEFSVVCCETSDQVIENGAQIRSVLVKCDFFSLLPLTSFPPPLQPSGGPRQLEEQVLGNWKEKCHWGPPAFSLAAWSSSKAAGSSIPLQWVSRPSFPPLLCLPFPSWAWTNYSYLFWNRVEMQDIEPELEIYFYVKGGAYLLLLYGTEHTVHRIWRSFCYLR